VAGPKLTGTNASHSGAQGIERKYFWRSQKIGAESPVPAG
jgi:hypothetical protein